MALDIERYVDQAKNGNRKALEALVYQIQGKIYGLALRMLNTPQDAEDEAQEILIKVITHLSDFRQESAFTSWVYRIACNHLLTKQKQGKEQTQITFEFLEEMFAHSGESQELTALGPERGFLLEEARFKCMQGVLSCLEKETRIVFILGEQYGVTGKEGGFILGITPEAFRKRLSRSRRMMNDFMLKHCGLVDGNNTCRCSKAAAKNREKEQTIPGKESILKKAYAEKSRAKLESHLNDLSKFDRTIAMYRRYPEYRSPDSFKNIIRDLIDSKKYNLLAKN